MYIAKMGGINHYPAIAGAMNVYPGGGHYNAMPNEVSIINT